MTSEHGTFIQKQHGELKKLSKAALSQEVFSTASYKH